MAKETFPIRDRDDRESKIKMIDQWLEQLEGGGALTPGRERDISRLHRLKDLESKIIITPEEEKEISNIHSELQNFESLG